MIPSGTKVQDSEASRGESLLQTRCLTTSQCWRTQSLRPSLLPSLLKDLPTSPSPIEIPKKMVWSRFDLWKQKVRVSPPRPFHPSHLQKNSSLPPSFSTSPSSPTHFVPLLSLFFLVFAFYLAHHPRRRQQHLLDVPPSSSLQHLPSAPRVGPVDPRESKPSTTIQILHGEGSGKVLFRAARFW